MHWQYRSPIPVGRRGVIFLLKWFLPAFATYRGMEGGRHPVGKSHPTNIGEQHAFFVFVWFGSIPPPPPTSVADPYPNPDPHVFGPPGSGSGSISQKVWIRIGIRIWIRIWILLSLSKNSKKNLDFYCFVNFFWLFTFEKWCKSTFKK